MTYSDTRTEDDAAGAEPPPAREICSKRYVVTRGTRPWSRLPLAPPYIVYVLPLPV
jgi:hypothetical protein